VFGIFQPDKTALFAANLPRKYPVKQWEIEKENEGQRLSLDGGLSVVSWGESKRQFLLVHGWESRATQLAGFVDALVTGGFRVIALDGPAHGQSAGKQANQLLFAQAVLKVSQQLGPFEGIVGHSMGGSALGIALADGLKCDKVVMISSPASIPRVLRRFAAFIGLPNSSIKLLS
jgi:pimeloyl-ACP methyl ester carboxylesterase